ncbi:diguanylate cyclase [Oceanispirochaeta crateris]|uniref:Diguanylate cyclase n=1 Tax=Oceanispirochaeta crateris TaxID=2518645 RepID=A0A5C1QIQ2_9SPIO|nr:diguanylate cyclase [Oceanispirochaeta crateris]QEN07347.1 diguanylate cyclase [Oceanispirochaeta crateris]
MIDDAMEPGKEYQIDESRQIYFSLVTFFILSSLFLIFTLLSAQFKDSFKLVHALSTLWLGTIFLRYDKKIILGEREVLKACFPLILSPPLLLYLMSSFQYLIIFNVVLAVFSIYFLYSFSLKEKTNILFYILFSSGYLLASIFHSVFSFMDIINSGAILLHILILSLGLAFRKIRCETEELINCRRSLGLLKNTTERSDDGDSLLGIYNKAGGMKVLRQTMKWSQRYEIPLTVCYMELNGSRDEHIHSITRDIFKRIRETDTLFRLGKSEMLLILPDCEKHNAASVMNHIKEVLSQNTMGKILHYGLADFQSELDRSPNELIISANQASVIA